MPRKKKDLGDGIGDEAIGTVVPDAPSVEVPVASEVDPKPETVVVEPEVEPVIEVAPEVPVETLMKVEVIGKHFYSGDNDRLVGRVNVLLADGTETILTQEECVENGIKLPEV